MINEPHDFDKHIFGLHELVRNLCVYFFFNIWYINGKKYILLYYNFNNNNNKANITWLDATNFD